MDLEAVIASGPIGPQWWLVSHDQKQPQRPERIRPTTDDPRPQNPDLSVATPDIRSPTSVAVSVELD